jgi:hypothetical protein
MAVAIAKVTSKSTVSNSPITTGTWTASSSLLYFAAGYARSAAATPTTPAVTGMGLTWTAVKEITTLPASGNGKRLSLFRAEGTAAATSGVLTFSYANTISDLEIFVDSASGFDNSGTNGDGAVIQATVASVTTSTLTAVNTLLAALRNANSATYSVSGNDASGAGVNWTSYTTVSNIAANANGESSFTQEALTGQTSVGAHWSVAGNMDLVGCEVAAQTGVVAAAGYGPLIGGVRNHDPMGYLNFTLQWPTLATSI